MAAITTNGLSRRFGRTQALDGVTVEIGTGEMVALIGASGSGKSTLIRHVAGLERADAGRVEVLGRTGQEGGRMLSRPDGSIAVLFQQFNLVGRMSVLMNVLMGHLGRAPRLRGTLGLFTAEEKAAGLAALSRVGIGQVAGQRASTLSGGQQQRAAIARCLVQKARILIADEPISALDPASARRVMDVLADVNARERMTVLVSLHQVEYARRYCRRTIAMRDGRVVYDGPTTALNNDFLAELYGAASEELVLPEAPPVAAAAPVLTLA
ncbi:phosphonate/organophosphate ester transporter subunit [Haematobacter missouriensis]|uniref:Phosphonate ABC transporter ATP-binding protein n=1 Tax=Haematobacter missouriensis TaxID=366616 RepID=A0A212AH74_9RHOB|nr:phosphonate ABC transporter ATP-binding protein [Haematobacter missouriensis]KFI28301.1 phosphonate/organophosphate ester transporter subunit [Haematobacter missouriensis]OWJ74604.1 phosphonate ABC transporter ATP-binding protein [Haematobacter missouriensis]OWJ80834.1 phosphonate ABC transporter ATP-binding protein [Haematobacter missouriensis]